MKSLSLLIMLLCTPLLSMENKIVPKFSPNVKWQDALKKTLQMVGDCENLSQTNKAWYKYCQKKFEVLHPKYLFETRQKYIQACPWKRVLPESTEWGPEWKFEIVQGDVPELSMIYEPKGRKLWLYSLDINKTIVSFRFNKRDFALISISPCPTMRFHYETIDEGSDEQILIEHDVYQFQIPNVTRFAPKSHFKPNECPLAALEGSGVVYWSDVDVYSEEITAAFIADFKPKFYPDFAQTLLKKQNKLKYFQ